MFVKVVKILCVYLCCLSLGFFEINTILGSDSLSNDEYKKRFFFNIIPPIKFDFSLGNPNADSDPMHQFLSLNNSEIYSMTFGFGFFDKQALKLSYNYWHLNGYTTFIKYDNYIIKQFDLNWTYYSDQFFKGHYCRLGFFHTNYTLPSFFDVEITSEAVTSIEPYFSLGNSTLSDFFVTEYELRAVYNFKKQIIISPKVMIGFHF